jgi:uncharacterized membrane protein YjjB (DUF3815 family)
MTLMDGVLNLLIDALWSGIAALGFAVLFNVPRRLLAACFFTGALGHASRTGIMLLGISTELSTLAGATLVGFTAQWLARRLDAPASIFGITGAIPMVPGVFAYRTMIGILSVAAAAPDATTALLVEAGTNAIKTALLLSAVAIGIGAPSLLFQRPRPVV